MDIAPAGRGSTGRSPTGSSTGSPTGSPSGRVLPVNELATEGPVTLDLPVPARVLAVGAHPDDIEFGCGATLAKWAAAGCTIHHGVLTDGSKGTWDPERDLSSLVAQRRAEQEQAAKILGGGRVFFLGVPDGELRNGMPEQWEVARWIRLVRPDVVIGHDPWRRYRLHPDHRHAGFVLTDAVVAARDPHFFPDQGLAPNRPDALLLWEADVPNHVEGVNGFAETKVQALLAHASQHQTTMGIADPAVAESDPETASFARQVLRQLREHGALGHVDYGESFHLITEL